jgi:hypothetical protein
VSGSGFLDADRPGEPAIVPAGYAFAMVMVAALLGALRIAFGARDEIAGRSRLGRGLLWTGTGVYTGWASAAVWVNLVTALADSGASVTGSVGIAGQLAVLAGATGTACAIAWWSRGLAAYLAAAVRAFVGAAIGTSRAGEQVSRRRVGRGDRPAAPGDGDAAARGYGLIGRRASRASAGAISSMRITRSTCTATTNVTFVPAEIAVASTA